MPRQNRVTPFGEIVAVPERGTSMGNRGVLHDDDERIKRAWQLKRWGDELLAWSHGGYRERRRRPKGEEVRMLTPHSTVKAIRAGYTLDIHPSALV